MTRARRGAIVAAIIAAAVVAGPVPLLGSSCVAHAREPGANRAGVVVQFGDLSLREYCVSFTEESITGIELLRRTGLSVVVQDYGGGSVTVCRIADEGCDYPGEPCFCRCVASACSFWGYYTVDDAGLWRFSQIGSGVRQIRDGDVDGWRWGQHTQGLGAPPPSDLSGICARGEQVAPAAEGRAPEASPSRVAAGPGPPAAHNAAGRRTPAPGATASPSVLGETHEPEPRGSVVAQAPAEPRGAPAKGRGVGSSIGLVAIVGALGAWGLRLGRARRAGAS